MFTYLLKREGKQVQFLSNLYTALSVCEFVYFCVCVHVCVCVEYSLLTELFCVWVECMTLLHIRDP